MHFRTAGRVAIDGGRRPSLTPVWAAVAWFALATAPAASARAIVDGTGVRVELPAAPRRVVSLAPDLTRTVVDLGAGSTLVGVSDLCDPPAPDVRRVGPLVQPSIEAIAALEPDLILATAEGNPRAVLERLRGVGLPVFGVAPHRGGIDGVVDGVEAVGRALGRGDAATRRVATLRRELAAVRRRAAALPRLSACGLVWTRPVIAAGAGTFLDDLLDLAGADNACRRGDEAYPRLSAEELVLARPDVVIVFGDTGEGGHAAGVAADWGTHVSAVRDGRVVRLDADLFLRPTLQLGRAATVLAEALAPHRAHAAPP